MTPVSWAGYPNTVLSAKFYIVPVSINIIHINRYWINTKPPTISIDLSFFLYDFFDLGSGFLNHRLIDFTNHLFADPFSKMDKHGRMKWF